MSSQLSLFSDDIPEPEPADKKKKNNTGSLKADNHLNDSEANLEPEALSMSNKTTEPVEKNVKFKAVIDMYNLSEEDIKVLEIEQEMSTKESLTDLEKIEYLNKIKTIAMGCQKCVLAKTRTQVVFSAGNPEAPIMLIGEGPGENEDKSGIPFVGRAGQLLDRILQSANISRENDIYITNVVKCRPPGNRTPFQDEVDACSIYLKNQLELTKSSIILLTGATAMKAILNSSPPISKVRGEWKEWNGKWVMPIFHPSYLLRNPSKDVGSPKWLMWQDIKKVKQKFEELKGM